MEQRDNHFDLEKIKELSALMTAYDIVEIRIVQAGESIFLKRIKYADTQEKKGGSIKSSISGEDTEKDIEVINSPMSGTFYAAVGPDSKPFVEVGSEVTPQTPVCIIEAMKVMNMINAETTGKIVKILAKNRQAVEKGQPLFKVKPMQ